MIRGAPFALLLLGCASPRAQTPSIQPALTEATACGRLCERLDGCGGAPGRCVADCERDRARLRAGFTASFVGCVDHELGPAACGPPVRPEARSGAIAMCYAATLDVWAERDRGQSLRRVLQSACRKRARCVPRAAIDEQQCIAELEARASAARKLLAVAEPALVERVAACVDASACDDDASVARCVQASNEPRASESRPQ